MDKVQSYIQRNQKRFLDELLEWLTIPSISADSKYKGDVAKAAAFIADKLKTAGAENVEITPTAGHPVVYGEKILDPALPTGVYLLRLQGEGINVVRRVVVR